MLNILKLISKCRGGVQKNAINGRAHKNIVIHRDV